VGGEGLGPVVKHLRHILDVAGEDTPALGSDWDGFIVPTQPLSDPLGLPLLVEALLGDGLSETAVGKIMRGNVMRVLGTA
jgi:membrane dipeptidase